MDKKINIVSLNIPWPPNYGGVIDIYYKIKALHDCGVGVILHCFEYGRPRASELESVCDEVYYYRRRTGLLPNITILPYNVYSRKDKRLIDNLLANDYPILFEGLHTCYYLTDKRLSSRFKIYRESNIEHDYYREIGKAEQNILKKLFFYIEALRFKWYQPKLAAANLMLAVSQTDCDYLRQKFPQNRIKWMACFHGNRDVTSVAGQSDFLLYHGNLSVKENEAAALYLIKNVFSHLSPYRCIIAGMNPSDKLLKAASHYANITIEADPSQERIDELVHSAQIIQLITFQGTGLKLKLLNSLFAGRHVAVNSLMLVGSGLDQLCHIADNADTMIDQCRKLMEIPFSSNDVDARRNILIPAFTDIYQIEKLVYMIFTKTDAQFFARQL